MRVRIINHTNKYQGRVDVGVNDANVWEGVKLILDNGDAGVCGSTLLHVCGWEIFNTIRVQFRMSGWAPSNLIWWFWDVIEERFCGWSGWNFKHTFCRWCHTDYLESGLGFGRLIVPMFAFQWLDKLDKCKGWAVWSMESQTDDVFMFPFSQNLLHTFLFLMFVNLMHLVRFEMKLNQFLFIFVWVTLYKYCQLWLRQ